MMCFIGIGILYLAACFFIPCLLASGEATEDATENPWGI